MSFNAGISTLCKNAWQDKPNKNTLTTKSERWMRVTAVHISSREDFFVKSAWLSSKEPPFLTFMRWSPGRTLYARSILDTAQTLPTSNLNVTFFWPLFSGYAKFFLCISQEQMYKFVIINIIANRWTAVPIFNACLKWLEYPKFNFTITTVLEVIHDKHSFCSFVTTLIAII